MQTIPLPPYPGVFLQVSEHTEHDLGGHDGEAGDPEDDLLTLVQDVNEGT